MPEFQLASNFRVSVKALIQDTDGRILMVKEAEEDWGIPGGGLAHGEDVVSGLKREINEELGATLKHVSGHPIMAKAFYDKKKERWKLWVVYTGKLANDPKVGQDATEIGWFRVEEVRNLPLDQTEDEAIIELVKSLDE